MEIKALIHSFCSFVTQAGVHMLLDEMTWPVGLVAVSGLDFGR